MISQSTTLALIKAGEVFYPDHSSEVFRRQPFQNKHYLHGIDFFNNIKFAWDAKCIIVDEDEAINMDNLQVKMRFAMLPVFMNTLPESLKIGTPGEVNLLSEQFLTVNM